MLENIYLTSCSLPRGFQILPEAHLGTSANMHAQMGGAKPRAAVSQPSQPASLRSLCACLDVAVQVIITYMVDVQVEEARICKIRAFLSEIPTNQATSWVKCRVG